MTTLRLVRSFPLATQLLFVNQLGINIGFYMLVPYLASYLGGDLGLSTMVVGVVLGVRTLSQQGLFLIGGSAADRLGPRRVIILGCALRVVGFGLFALSTGLPALLTASILTGLAGALFNPAVRTYLAHDAGERRAEAFSLFSVFANLGALLGPLVGSLLLAVSFRTTALVAATVFALLTLVQALVLPATPTTRATRGVLADWRTALTDRRFWAFTLALSGVFALQNQLYLALPLGLEQATGSAGLVALLFAVTTATDLALQVRVTHWCQRHWSRGRSLTVGLAVMGASFLPPLLAGPPRTSGWVATALPLATILLAATLLEVGLVIVRPFMLELVTGFAPDSLTGTYYGVFYLAQGVAAAAGNALIGRAADVTAGLWPMWLGCAAIGAVSAAAVARLEHAGALQLPEPAPTRPG